MENKLLLQLLQFLILEGDAPDILEREYEPDIIRFEWFSGRVIEYPYDHETYNKLWDIFNKHWQAVA